MNIPVAGGIAVASRGGQGGPESAAVGYVAGALSAGAAAVWAAYRDDLASALPGLLGRADMIAAGVTLYDVLVELSDDPPAVTLSRDASGDLLVHVVTGRNSITATATQPTALGKWADPRISFQFGLDVSYRIDLPPVTSKLTATGFTDILITDPQFDSHNFPADVLMVVNAIWAWASGTDHVALLEEQIAQLDLAAYVNEPLAPVNKIVESLAAKGYYYLEALIDRADEVVQLPDLSFPEAPPGMQELVLLVTAPDVSGAVEGDIRWSTSIGRPVPPGWNRVVTGVGALRGTPVSAASAVGVANEVPDLVAASGVSTVPGEVRNGVETLTLTARKGDVTALGRLGGRHDVLSRVTDAFRRGPLYFKVSAQLTMPDGSTREAGRLASQWFDEEDGSDDSEGWRTLHYRLEEVPTDMAVQVRCELSDEYEWQPAGAVTCSPDGWRGSVTCRPFSDLTEAVSDVSQRVRAQTSDGLSLTRSVGDLAERGIIIVGGREGDGEEPVGQPLGEERLRTSVVGALAAQPGERVSLNPQPIPPGRTFELKNASLPLSGEPGDAGAATASADRFGRITLQQPVESRLLDPVEDDPTGYGTVTGIDFHVEPQS